MVTKTLFKTIPRMFKKHFARFMSLFLIVLVSVGFISGFGMAADKIDASLNNYYKSQNIGDFIIKSTSMIGFGKEDITKVKKLFPNAEVEAVISFDVPVSESRSVRYIFRDLSDMRVNVPTLYGDYTFTDSVTGVYVDPQDKIKTGMTVGESFVLDFASIILSLANQYLGADSQVKDYINSFVSSLEPVTLTVAGTTQTPHAISKEGEPSYNNSPDTEVPKTSADVQKLNLLENIVTASIEVVPASVRSFISATDIYVALDNREIFNCFSDEYHTVVEQGKAAIAEALPQSQTITLYENYGISALSAYGNKLAVLGYIVMAVFLIVTMLVSFSTIGRLLDEERAQTACLVTLGYDTRMILTKYVLFAITATALGGAGAYLLSIGVSSLVYTVFWASFAMPPMVLASSIVFYLVTLFLIMTGTVLVTVVSGIKTSDTMPAVLLRPKVPRAGRRVFLELIPFVWQKIPFRYKSTLRSIFRYVNRFLMSVVSIAFSTGLVLAGLALLDLCLFHMEGTAAIVGVSVLIIVFAGLLTAVVIHTLTNISISERNREIATLTVLGYRDSEVAWYIYREVYFNTAVGTVIGYPMGVLLIWLLYNTIGYGTLQEISWFMWVAAPIVSTLFTFIVTLMLRKKLLSIDMNDSLKAVE